MSRPAPIAHPIRLAAALAAAACAAAAPAQDLQARIRLKYAPPGARVLVDGAEAAPRAAGRGGARDVPAPAGKRRVRLEAEGYLPREAELESTTAPRTADLKLERAGTEFVLEGFAATAARPKSVEFSPDGRLLVAAPLSGSAPEAFDAVSLAKIADLRVPEKYAKLQGFVETVFLPARGEVWVSQMAADAVHVFSLASLSYVATVPSGGTFPKAMAVHPDGSRVFVSNWVSRDVSVLDAAERKAVARIALPGTPRGLAFSPDGKDLFVADFDGGVEIVDARTYERKARILEGGAKRHLAVDAARNVLYASDMAAYRVYAWDLAAGRLLGSVRTPPNPNTLKLSPDGTELFVCARGTNDPVDYEREGPDFGELIVLDAPALAVKERHWGGDQPTGLCVAPDGDRVVFTDFLDRRLEAYRRVRPEGAQP